MNTSRLKTGTFNKQNHAGFLRGLDRAIVGRKCPQLLLVAFLHFAPICKVLYSAGNVLPATPAAIVLRWAAAIAAMVGTYHTVSAASAAIVGLTRYVNNTPQGSPTNNAVVLEGGVFRYRITVSNAGSDHNKDYFNCIPMPAGLTMNTNLGGNGFITNAPNSRLVPGVYPVRLYAGNTSYPRPVTYDATITVIGTGTPPQITTDPADQSVGEGQSATFTVVATGTDLAYQWRFNSGALPGQTNASLIIASTTPAHAGSYTVVVSNSLGSVTSNPAQLTVIAAAPLTLGNPHYENGSFAFEASDVGAGAYILWGSTDFTTWTAISTNVPASGVVRLSDPAAADEKRFYLLSTTP
jgi:hypothetical protein